MTLNKERVQEIIAEILDVEIEEVLENANFVEDLEADSLKALELLAALEREFGIRISENKLGKLRSLNETYDVLVEIMC